MSAAIAAGLLSALLAPGARWMALRFGAVDYPGGRRHHTGPVPRAGGLAIAGAFLVVVGAGAWRVGWPALTADNPDAARLIQGLLLAGGLAAVLGFVDDVRQISPRAQLASHTAIAAVAMSFGLWLQQFTNPFSGRLIDLRGDLGAAGLTLVVVVTALWYAGFINTVNWLDGIDGLAATVGAVAAVLFALHMVEAFDQGELALLPAALAGACIGFLPWNLPPARMFMGSSGSTFLGFALAALALVAPAKVATALLVMWVPIMDVGWQIVIRARRGQAPWLGDRGHLHHRLYDRGWSPLAVVAMYGAVAAVTGGIAVLVPVGFPGRGQVKLLSLAVVGALTLGGLWRLAQDDAAMIADDPPQA